MTIETTPPRSIPQDALAERGMVGSLLKDPTLLESVRIFATPAMVVDEQAAAVFQTISALADAGKPVDRVSVIAELRRRKSLEGQELEEILLDLRNTVPTTAHAEYYAAAVREKATLRSLITLCGRVQRSAFDGGETAADVVDALQNGAAKIAEQGVIDAGKLAGDILGGVLEELHGWKDTQLAGLSTGFPELDQRIGGLKRKHLITIGGAGKIGKTSFAVNILGHVGLVLKQPAAIISHEMTAEELTERLLISTVGVSRDRLQSGRMTTGERNLYEDVQAAIRESRIVIDDAAPTTIHGTRVRLRLFQRLYKIKLAVIDYFQLMTGSDVKARRYDQLVEVSRGLKQIAVDLDIPIIVLAQLNAEGQDSQRPPRVTDIEECKRIFKDSNVVILLDREYERRRHDRSWMAEQGSACRTIGTIDVAAIRAGEAGVIPAHYHGAVQRWRSESMEIPNETAELDFGGSE